MTGIFILLDYTFSTTGVAAAAGTLWSAQPVCDPIAWDDFIIWDYRKRILQECRTTSEPEKIPVKYQ